MTLVSWEEWDWGSLRWKSGWKNPSLFGVICKGREAEGWNDIGSWWGNGKPGVSDRIPCVSILNGGIPGRNGDPNPGWNGDACGWWGK